MGGLRGLETFLGLGSLVFLALASGLGSSFSSGGGSAVAGSGAGSTATVGSSEAMGMRELGFETGKENWDLLVRGR